MSAFIYTLTYFTRGTYICDIYEPWKVESRASQVGKLMDPRKRTPHTDSSSNVRLRMTPPESVPYTPLQPDSERGLDSTLTSRMTFPGRNLAFFFYPRHYLTLVTFNLSSHIYRCTCSLIQNLIFSTFEIQKRLSCGGWMGLVVE